MEVPAERRVDGSLVHPSPAAAAGLGHRLGELLGGLEGCPPREAVHRGGARLLLRRQVGELLVGAEALVFREGAHQAFEGAGAPRARTVRLPALLAELDGVVHPASTDQPPASRHELLLRFGILAVDLPPLPSRRVGVELRHEHRAARPPRDLVPCLQPQRLFRSEASRVRAHSPRSGFLLVQRVGSEGLEPGDNPRHDVELGVLLEQHRRPLPEGRRLPRARHRRAAMGDGALHVQVPQQAPRRRLFLKSLGLRSEPHVADSPVQVEGSLGPQLGGAVTAEPFHRLHDVHGAVVTQKHLRLLPEGILHLPVPAARLPGLL
mmetsp:Transcript_11680/g.27755  ORF Transcript_11680/g.27755 Transcript_11680/m.27755 type:complete len:321 (+) Transcript_11680:1925-2887(+)